MEVGLVWEEKKCKNESFPNYVWYHIGKQVGITYKGSGTNWALSKNDLQEFTFSYVSKSVTQQFLGRLSTQYF